MNHTAGHWAGFTINLISSLITISGLHDYDTMTTRSYRLASNEKKNGFSHGGFTNNYYSPSKQVDMTRNKKVMMTNREVNNVYPEAKFPVAEENYDTFRQQLEKMGLEVRDMPGDGYV